MPDTTQHLIYAGKKLKNDKVLTEYHRECTLHLITMCSGD